MAKKEQKKKSESRGIEIGGNVGPGSVIGSGSVKADYIAGGNIVVGPTMGEVADAFRKIYAAIEAKRFSSISEAQAVREAVEIIEAENEKGDNANEKVVRLSLHSILQMAPDIWEVAVATFVNPIQGISTIIRKIAERAKAESEDKN